MNPADCASRGLTAKELKDYVLWWKGPSWLVDDSSMWPTLPLPNKSTKDLEERSKILPKVVHLCIKNQIWDLQNRFSNLTKLLRVTATCKRAIKCFRNQSKSLAICPLSPAEINEARLFWIKLIQHQYFSKEISCLQQKQEIPNSSSLLKLTLFIDRQGLLRVGGRLNHSSLSTDTKHPYILPKDVHFSILIIDEAHKRVFHGSTQDTLMYIRNQYWILGGRNPIRSFILKCVRCTRYRRLQASQLMGQLPYSRVNPNRAFLHTGLDYAGPYVIKTWKGRLIKLGFPCSSV
ncbi:uncharacterized protein [Chelonus insularis]|uniref:uncharacterized protein n=1 Tax=Chelonus insularis TaxID=460826 RepID=UPI0015890E95|nr:uncharacterized protein LOC118074450 [Chelonus insularis]